MGALVGRASMPSMLCMPAVGAVGSGASPGQYSPSLWGGRDSQHFALLIFDTEGWIMIFSGVCSLFLLFSFSPPPPSSPAIQVGSPGVCNACACQWFDCLVLANAFLASKDAHFSMHAEQVVFRNFSDGSGAVHCTCCSLPPPSYTTRKCNHKFLKQF